MKDENKVAPRILTLDELDELIRKHTAGEISRLRALNAELVEALEYVWDKVLTEYYNEESPIREKAYRALLRAKGEA